MRSFNRLKVNPVAKTAWMFNKSKQFKDRKKALKRGESKHRPVELRGSD